MPAVFFIQKKAVGKIKQPAAYLFHQLRKEYKDDSKPFSGKRTILRNGKKK